MSMCAGMPAPNRLRDILPATVAATTAGLNAGGSPRDRRSGPMTAAQASSSVAPGGVRSVRTMCPMNCNPTYCGMIVDVQDDRVLRIRGDKENPDSRGFLCIRGQAAGEIVDNPLRILQPRLRERREPDGWREASWDEALDRITTAMLQAGPEAVA